MFGYRRAAADDLTFDETDSAAAMPKAIVLAPDTSAGAAAPLVPWSCTVLYELHVRGFSTQHEAIPATIRGTFAALADPASVAYLQKLGVTSVEIMPPAAWLDERHLPPLGLRNYWGYNPVGWMAPDPTLAPGGWAEVRAAVDALAAAGIETIVDVVFNHSAESDELGPTVSLRGLDNASYYRLAENRRYYANATGTGHELATERPAVLRLVTGRAAHLGATRRRARVPLRSGGHAGSARGRVRPGRAAAGGDRPGPGIARAEDDRRAVGHRAGRLPGSAIFRRPGASGTTSSATPSGASGVATAACSAIWRRGWPAPATCSRRSGGPRAASTSLSRMTALPSPTSFHLKKSTTRRTASRTATAPAPTIRGTTARRGRATTPRSARRGSATSARCWRRCCWRAARRCWRWAANSGIRRPATTTPMRRTTRRAGSTGPAPSRRCRISSGKRRRCGRPIRRCGRTGS